MSESVVDLWRGRAQHYGIRPDQIHVAGKMQLLALQRHLDLGDQWGLLQVPKEWLPAGSSVRAHGLFRLAQTTLKIARSAEEVELANLMLTRLVLLLLLTSPFRRRGGGLAIRTIVESVQIIEKSLIRPALRLPATSSGLLSRIDAGHLNDAALDETPRWIENRDRELARITELNARGMWSDLPSLVPGDSFEISRRSKRPRESADNDEGTHLPFSDEFVAQAGWRVAWITQHLAKPLTLAAEQLQALRLSLPSRICKKRLRGEERDLLSNILLLDGHGKQIQNLPFPITGGRDTWPPKTLPHVYMLLERVQAAHLFVVLLSTGGRISEVLSLKTDCLVERTQAEGSTTATGRTFKLEHEYEGKLRDWPLPTLAIDAVKNQVALMRLAGYSEKPRPLWCTFQSATLGEEFTNYRYQLKNLTSWLGMEHLLGDQAMRPHRFRKTIARLVALAVVDSPKVLMDIFGHRSITMTMGYILADPMIRAEMDTVRRELVVMFASKAIENAATNGGPAAAPLKSAIRNAQIRTGMAWQQDNIRELAITLTANGDHWTLVRPGVLCTKQPSQSGPCNAGKSMPDPSRCRTVCGHRLEDASARDDANRSIQQAVEFAEAALEAGDEIAMELWVGQIFAHINRFDDLKNKWKVSPIVAKILNEKAVAT